MSNGSNSSNAIASSSNSVRPPSKSSYSTSNSSSRQGGGAPRVNNTGGTGTGANGKPSDSIVRPGGPVAAAVKPVALVGGARVIMGPSGGALGSGSSSKLGVNPNQKGNPIIGYVKGIGWEYTDTVADYQVGATRGLLYLSLRYHLLHPEYIHGRIEKIGKSFSMRILLVQCDVDNHAASIKELTKICIINDYTMMVAWSSQESGRYLEIYKSFETKAPDLIKERVETSHIARLNAALTSVRGVNKTDVTTLATTFGSFKSIVTAQPNSLIDCIGIGEKKMKRMRDAFTGPFTLKAKRKKSQAEANGAEGNAMN